MALTIPESLLPLELSAFAAVEAAYPQELERTTDALRRGLPVLLEADKELTPYLYKAVRDRLKKEGRQFIYLDGRPLADLPQPPAGLGLVGTIVFYLREAVRGAVEQRVLVLPHLDLLVTSVGGLTSEAREVIPLLYENPELVTLGFKDPSFPLPRVSPTSSTSRSRASTRCACGGCWARWPARTTRPTPGRRSSSCGRPPWWASSPCPTWTWSGTSAATTG